MRPCRVSPLRRTATRAVLRHPVSPKLSSSAGLRIFTTRRRNTTYGGQSGASGEVLAGRAQSPRIRLVRSVVRYAWSGVSVGSCGKSDLEPRSPRDCCQPDNAGMISMNTKTFVESMRALCADEVQLGQLGLLTPFEELVPAILATLTDLESGRLAVPVDAADS